MVAVESPPAVEEIVSAAAPHPDPPDPCVYHGILGELVRTLDPYTEADPVGVLSTALAAMGNVVGVGPHYLVSGRRHGFRLNTVLVGATSSGRKGSAWAAVKPVLEAARGGWAKNCLASGLSSGEGLIWAVRDPIVAKEPIKVKGRVEGYQMVETDAGVADKRLFVAEEEFAGLLKHMARETNTLSVVIRQAWDGGDLRILTKNSAARASDPHITIYGHITPEELLKHLDSNEAANGFGNRFLWLCVRRSKLLPDGASPSEGETLYLANLLDRALEDAAEFGIERLTFSPAAREAWHAVYQPLTEGGPGLVGALLARGAPYVIRLAGLYALLAVSPVIDLPHLEAALALWGYNVASVHHIFGAHLGDPIADTILAALAGGELTKTELHHLFDNNATKEEIDAALAALLAAGKIVKILRRPVGRGKTATIYRLVEERAADD